MKSEHRLILEWVEQDSAVLELGCGEGELLSTLVREKHVRAQGIEIDQHAIQECVAKGLNVFHEDIDTGLSVYPDKSFDFVILAQSLQQVKKPDFVLKEAVRVGKKIIVSFPNFAYYKIRLQILFGGKVPVTPALPYEWHDTPNLHFLSISDFTEYCKRRNLRIERSAFVRNEGRVRVLPNLFADVGIFLISK
jgi:methionine biosynthesis protein MetW